MQAALTEAPPPPVVVVALGSVVVVALGSVVVVAFMSAVVVVVALSVVVDVVEVVVVDVEVVVVVVVAFVVLSVVFVSFEDNMRPGFSHEISWPMTVSSFTVEGQVIDSTFGTPLTSSRHLTPAVCPAPRAGSPSKSHVESAATHFGELAELAVAEAIMKVAA